MATRLISSAVGIVLLIVVICLRDTFAFPLALGIVAAIIIYELAKAVGADKFRLALTASVLYVPVCEILGFVKARSGWLMPYMVMAAYFVTFLFLLCLLLTFLKRHGEFRTEQLCFLIVSVMLVDRTIETMDQSMQIGNTFYFLMSLGGAWIADSGAYFAGVTLGKHKLCPNISPKKTVEGFVGGLLCNMIVFPVVFNIYLRAQGADVASSAVIVEAAVLGLVCALVSVIGDLTASVIKREKGIKDFGNIMPGHGGLMDRFDSILFVVPVYWFTLNFLPDLKY